MRLQLLASTCFQLLRIIGICGAMIKATRVAKRPEFTEARTTGDSAYKKLAVIVMNWLLESFRRNEWPDHIIRSGAAKKNIVIKSGVLPRNRVDANATTAIQAGDACELPIPTWCQDSK